MFKFLKDKIKSAVSKLSEKIEEEGKQEEIESSKEEPLNIEQQKAAEPTKETLSSQEQKEQAQPEPPTEPLKEEKKGFFSALTGIFKKKEEQPEESQKQELSQESPKESLKEVQGDQETIQEQQESSISPPVAPEEKKSPIEHFAPQIVEEVKKEFTVPKEEPKLIHPIEKESQKRPEQTGHLPSSQHAHLPKQHHVQPKHEHKEHKKEHIHVEQKKEVQIATSKKEPVASAPIPVKHSEHLKVEQKKAVLPSEPIQEQPQVQKTPSSSIKPSKEEILQDIQKKEPNIQEPKEEKKGFFSALKERILTTTINEQQFEDMFFDLELALLENNVAVEVIDKIKHDLKSSLVNHPIRRSKVEETVIISLKDSIKGLFETPFDLISKIKGKSAKPFIIAFVGINGSGKTTSIAKMAFMLKEQGFSVVLAAGDTFRAASIEQLAQHGDKLGIKVIKHDYGADPAAVAFDAIKHAEAKNVDVVLIDTAGRMHSNENLIQEMQKIIRVAKPDVKLFVGESITGNDCVEQAKSFNEAIGLDGIILSKADIDEKGGAAVSVSFVTKKPILYIGTGQEYKDIKPFDAAVVMENLGLEG